MENISKKIDHTLLKASATQADIIRICAEAKQYGFASVCVNSCYAKLVTRQLRGTDVKTCCVVGFPLGAMSTAAKAYEAKCAVEDGASEIDMVINVGALKEGNDLYVEEDISAVVEAAKPAIVKVIIETCLLTDEEKIKMCRVVSDSDADYIKTSTGFSTGGATKDDIRLFAQHMKNGKKIKAAGGIASIGDAAEFIALGAKRLGTSRIVKLIKGAGEDGSY